MDFRAKNEHFSCAEGGPADGYLWGLNLG